MDYEVKNVIVEEDDNKEKSESIISIHSLPVPFFFISLIFALAEEMLCTSARFAGQL